MRIRDGSADVCSSDLLQGLAVAKDGMQQLLQRKPEIVEKVAVEHAVLALLKRLNVERPRIGIVVEPMARFLDQRLIDARRSVRLGKALIARQDRKSVG